jgi:hypothetical protein
MAVIVLVLCRVTPAAQDKAKAVDLIALSAAAPDFALHNKVL